MTARRALRWVEQHQPQVAWAVLGLAMAGAGVLFSLLQRDLFFASDETSWLFTAGTGGGEDFLRPDNGHLLVLPFVTGRVILETAGPGYGTFSLIGVLGGLAAGAAMFEYARRRVGPVWALAPALVVLFFGSGWPQLLQGWLGMQQLWPLAFGLGALILVELDERWADVTATALLVLALASFSTGVAFTAGVAVFTLLGQDRWRRAFVWAVPAALYLAWRIWAAIRFGEHEGSLANLLWLPGYFVDAISVSVLGAFGRESLVGPGQVTALKLGGFSFDQFASAAVWTALAAIGVALAARPVLRRGASRTLLAALAVLATQWIGQCYLLRADRTPGELRYLFADAFILLVVVLAAVEGRRLSRLAQVCIAALVPVAVIGMLPALKDYRSSLAAYAPDARADLAVFDLGGPSLNPSFRPATDAPGVGASALYLTGGEYAALRERYGPFGMTLPELKQAPEAVRVKADGVYARALGVVAVPQPGFPGCPGARTGAGSAVLPRRGALVRASATSPFSLRRFGAGFGVPVGGLPGGEFARIAIPADRDPTPWVLRAPAGGALVACPLPAS